VNCLYKKIMIFALLVTSIQLQTGHKKFIYPPKIEVKGVLKSVDGFVPSHKNKKICFTDNEERTSSEFPTEEDYPQEWQTTAEDDQAREEVAKLSNAVEDQQRWQAVIDRNAFIIKATKYDNLRKRYKELKRKNKKLVKNNKVLEYCDSDSSS